MEAMRRNFAVCCMLCALAGWWAHDITHRPPERPVLSFIAKAAKAALWVFLIAEHPKEKPVYAHESKDGYAIIDHGKAL